MEAIFSITTDKETAEIMEKLQAENERLKAERDRYEKALFLIECHGDANKLDRAIARNALNQKQEK